LTHAVAAYTGVFSVLSVRLGKVQIICRSGVIISCREGMRLRIM
jgi:hypothetical protein